jgi:hypothetical protein
MKLLLFRLEVKDTSTCALIAHLEFLPALEDLPYISYALNKEIKYSKPVDARKEFFIYIE